MLIEVKDKEDLAKLEAAGYKIRMFAELPELGEIEKRIKKPRGARVRRPSTILACNITFKKPIRENSVKAVFEALKSHYEETAFTCLQAGEFLLTKNYNRGVTSSSISRLIKMGALTIVEY